MEFACPLFRAISFKTVKLSPNALDCVFERVGHYLVHFLIFIIYCNNSSAHLLLSYN